MPSELNFLGSTLISKEDSVRFKTETSLNEKSSVLSDSESNAMMNKEESTSQNNKVKEIDSTFRMDSFEAKRKQKLKELDELVRLNPVSYKTIAYFKFKNHKTKMNLM